MARTIFIDKYHARSGWVNVYYPARGHSDYGLMWDTREESDKPRYRDFGIQYRVHVILKEKLP